MTRHVVGLGGAAVIFAIVLIFVYLLWVVAPIFVPAEIEASTEWPTPTKPLLVGSNDSVEVVYTIGTHGCRDVHRTVDRRDPW